MSVMIVTSLGDMVVDLHTQHSPLTCKNFLKLCKIKYYNGALFHTIQKDFTAQTGDPTGTGSGGDSIYKFLYGQQARFFGDEIKSDLKHSKMGTIAMASAGQDLNASQFYITLRDDIDYLDGKHTVFGEVAEGMETLRRINEAYVDDKGRPFKNIRIKHTYVLDDPFDDPPQLMDLIPDASPKGKPIDEVDDHEVRLEDDWVSIDERLSSEELEEVLHAMEAHSRAVVLESIGDIPNAEIKPPENVLFVCKLNPVTEDEDLHTIFARFGTVILAEIIRDYKTNDSLCYAFIEFEEKGACEEAYFRMDNALIDDRRILVDFSQSISKLWYQYRRKGGLMNKGKGCFKCGSLNHIAKDCTGNPIDNQKHVKYMIKDDSTRHRGDDDSKYEMVFEERDSKKRRVDNDIHGERRREERDSKKRSGNNEIRGARRNERDSRKRDADNGSHGDRRHYKRSRADVDVRGGQKDERDSKKRDERDLKKKRSGDDTCHREHTNATRRDSRHSHDRRRKIM